MIYPNYTDGSIINLVSSILAHYGVSNIYKPLKDFSLPPHKHIVFIVIDGLGLNYLQAHGSTSALCRHKVADITSVFPSTTSAALTSLMTGVAPLQHGLTGWFMYFKELATATLPLSFKPRFTDKTFTQMDVKIEDILDFETIFHKIKKSMLLVSPQETINSAFSTYCYGNKAKVGYDKLKECFDTIKMALTQGTEMIYAYIPHFDEVAHHYGVNSPQAINCFQQIDALYSDLLNSANLSDTIILVTADHGLIDSPKDRVLNIANFPELKNCLILPLSGEPRVPYCYVRPAHLEKFRHIIDNEMSDYCDRYPLAELLGKNVYGTGTPNPKTIDRIGDEILVMKENYVMIDKVYHEQQKEFIGFHGGFHPDEMIVPLIMS